MNKRNLIPGIIGVIGALIGFYIWKDYLPGDSGDTIKDWIWILRIKSVIFLYIPSCLAIVASLFNKKYLMLLAFLISLPVTKYLHVKPLLMSHTIPVYYPLLFYSVSLLLMIKGKKIGQ